MVPQLCRSNWVVCRCLLHFVFDFLSCGVIRHLWLVLLLDLSQVDNFRTYMYPWVETQTIDVGKHISRPRNLKSFKDSWKKSRGIFTDIKMASTKWRPRKPCKQFNNPSSFVDQDRVRSIGQPNHIGWLTKMKSRDRLAVPVGSTTKLLRLVDQTGIQKVGSLYP